MSTPTLTRTMVSTVVIHKNYRDGELVGRTSEKTTPTANDRKIDSIKSLSGTTFTYTSVSLARSKVKVSRGVQRDENRSPGDIGRRHKPGDRRRREKSPPRSDEYRACSGVTYIPVRTADVGPRRIGDRRDSDDGGPGDERGGVRETRDRVL